MIETVIQIAKEAGDILMNYFDQNYDVSYKENSQDYPVTKADLEADNHIHKRLRKEFPEDQILSEEAVAEDIDFSGRVWVIDPMDGTTLFTHKRKGFAVHIGFCVDGEPQLGIVNCPALKEMYYAEKGKGAFLIKNGETSRINVSKVKELKDATRHSSDPYSQGKEFDKWLDSLDIKDTMSPHGGPLGLKSMSLASGKADFFIISGKWTCKWDTCGPQVIIEEAGGKVTDQNGEKLDYKKNSVKFSHIIVASNGYLHKTLLDKVKDFTTSLQNIPRT